MLYKIKEIIGDKQLHVQVTSHTFEEMVKEAETIVKNIDKNVYIKVPTNEEGIKTMKVLKENGYNVTATAIYTVQQAVMAASVGADYAAPYFNRMCNNNYNAPEAISEMAKMYTMYNKPTKLLAASFKNTNQIMQALLSGAEAVTVSPELYTMMFDSPLSRLPFPSSMRTGRAFTETRKFTSFDKRKTTCDSKIKKLW